MTEKDSKQTEAFDGPPPNVSPNAPHEPRGNDGLIVDLDGYEGPLDILLTLARNHKIDIRAISMSALAEQFLKFVSDAVALRLEVAADYLVMAAWLAYLKSRLLLPKTEEEDGPSGEEMAELLAFRLRRLEAMRDASARLLARDRLGRDVFARGMPEGVRVIKSSTYDLSLYELLKGYTDQKSRAEAVAPLEIRRPSVFALDAALGRLRRILGTTPDWTVLEQFLPQEFSDGDARRSGIAGTFVAALELAREGKAQIRQSQAFGPLYVRANPDE